MPYEDELRDSLSRLYIEAREFRVSIEIIVKLAKSLKLDTFVDTEEFPGVTRLSIAGSLLLLEIDFKDDHTVSKVSLSSGNHLSQTSAGDHESSRISSETGSEIRRKIDSSATESKIVAVSFHPDLRTSFFKTSHDVSNSAPGSVAERILFDSLAGPKLGSFPANLKYLADLDRVSPPDGDLIVYIENLATYLAAIHHKEQELSHHNWELALGFTSSVGKVLLNDGSKKHVGVYLQYWQGSRILNHAFTSKSEPEIGTVYKALLAIEESQAPAADHILEARNTPWRIRNESGQETPFFFQGETEDAHLHDRQSVTADSKWKLVLRFSDPIIFPLTLLEYLGITDYEVAKPLELAAFLNKITETGEIMFKLNESEFSFASDECTRYASLQAVSLVNLHSLVELLPALRNSIVLSQIIGSVALDKKSEFCQDAESPIDEETKQKIRDTLQLSSDVPDTELLGLGMISNDYMGVQMLDREPEPGRFTKDGSMSHESPATNSFEEDTGNSPGSSRPLLSVRLVEICYGLPESDFILQFAGNINGSTEQAIDSRVRIHNGQISADKSTEDMEIDTEENTSKQDLFARSLALSESIPLSLEFLRKSNE